MLQDARQWLNSGKIEDVRQARSGATALHVAAAKGYSEVLRYCAFTSIRSGSLGEDEMGFGSRGLLRFSTMMRFLFCWFAL